MKSVKVKIVLFSTIFLWASAFVGIKMSLVSFSPGALALLRFMVASVCMAIIYQAQGITQTIPWKDRTRLLLAGMAGIGIYNVCLNYGELALSAGVASFIVGLMPVLTILLSMLFLGEKLNSGVWSGILISLLGLLILALGEGVDVSMRQGILLVLISALMGAILTILQKQFAYRYHPIAVTAWIMWGGTLLLFVFLPNLAQEMHGADLQSTASCIYLGVFPAALAYLAWGYVLKYISATKASISLYGMPILSTLLEFVFLGEIPTSSALMGGAIALTGALVANRYQNAPSIDTDFEDKAIAA